MIVRRIEPTGHDAALFSRLEAALLEAGFQNTADPDALAPPPLPGVVGVLFAWDSHVLDTCSRLIEEHYGEAVLRGAERAPG
jgi:hypothetical protein